MDSLKYIYIFLSAFVLALVFVPLCGSLARKYRILDRPDNKLKKHSKAVPYLGGAAIFFAFFFTLTVNQLFEYHTLKGIAGLTLAGTLIFTLGLVDDIKKLRVPLKFCVQTLAALILVVCGIKIQFLGNELLNIAVTLLWVVGITNAFNLLDIMDGLSSGIAVLAALTYFVLGVEAGKIFSPLAALSLAGACLGFLVYNFNPARIFMGDAGSLFLGFMLAALSLTESYTLNNDLAVLTPILILGVPIFDTLFVMWMRVRQGKPVYFGSPDHFPLRLLRFGLPVKKVVLLAYSAGLVLALAAYSAVKLSAVQAALLYLLVFAAALFSAVKLSKLK